MKIKLITCYFGRLPEWINIWILSCGYNPEYDFLVVTDDDKTEITQFPGNVEFYRTSLHALKERFQRAIGCEIVLDKPYKLCDYKPIYGLAFSDLLQGYDYWGHCDLDMLFGKLSDFISQEVLEESDRIGKVGAFTLYRNTEKMNRLYLTDDGVFSWKEVFASPINYGYDEYSGMNRMMRRRPELKWHILESYYDANPYLDRIGLASLPEILIWEQGKVCGYCCRAGNAGIEKTEYAYLHFSGKKPKVLCNLNRDKQILIRSDNMTGIQEDVDAAFVRKYTEFVSEAEDIIDKRCASRKKILRILRMNAKEKRVWFRRFQYIHFGH